MTDPRQPVLDHLAYLRRERWKMLAWFVAMAAVGLFVAVLCMVWAAERPEEEARMWTLICLGMLNAWTVASIIVRMRHHWVAILLMERQTRAQLDWFDKLRLGEDEEQR